MIQFIIDPDPKSLACQKNRKILQEIKGLSSNNKTVSIIITRVEQ